MKSTDASVYRTNSPAPVSRKRKLYAILSWVNHNDELNSKRANGVLDIPQLEVELLREYPGEWHHEKCVVNISNCWITRHQRKWNVTSIASVITSNPQSVYTNVDVIHSKMYSRMPTPSRMCSCVSQIIWDDNTIINVFTSLTILKSEFGTHSEQIRFPKTNSKLKFEMQWRNFTWQKMKSRK